MYAPARHARHAFTLLELTIAMVMAAVLIAAISSSLGSAFKARSSAQNAVEPGRTLELAVQLMRSDIESALPPNTTSTQVLAGSFVGLSDTIDFFSTADSPEHVDGNGEIKEVIFALEAQPGSNEQALVRRVVRNIAPLAQNPPAPDEEVVCRGVTSFGLQYFDGTEWQPVWDSTQNNNTLPSAVEVTMELQRPAPNGQTRVVRNVSVFTLPCSTTTPGNSSGGGSGLLSF